MQRSDAFSDGLCFSVLNMHKIYLVVDKENEKAVHVYKRLDLW